MADALTPEQLTASVYAPAKGGRPWKLEDLTIHPRLRFYSRGRYALAEALRLIDAADKTILFPKFICSEAAAAAAKPAFFDGPGALAGAPAAAAVVAVNYFGFPENLAPFEAYCRRTGAILIEDNAHGLFSRDAQGRALGTRAPLGVFSLRKTLRLPDGGALAVNDERLFAKVSPQLPFQDRGPVRAKRFLSRVSPTLGAAATLRLIGMLRSVKGKAQGGENPPPEPCAALNSITLNEAAEVSRRRGLYAFCEKLLGQLASPFFPSLPDGVAPYGYPFRCEAARLPEIEKTLASAGLYSLPWPDPPTDVRLVHFLW